MPRKRSKRILLINSALETALVAALGPLLGPFGDQSLERFKTALETAPSDRSWDRSLHRSLHRSWDRLQTAFLHGFCNIQYRVRALHYLNNMKVPYRCRDSATTPKSVPGHHFSYLQMRKLLQSRRLFLSLLWPSKRKNIENDRIKTRSRSVCPVLRKSQKWSLRPEIL